MLASRIKNKNASSICVTLAKLQCERACDVGIEKRPKEGLPFETDFE